MDYITRPVSRAKLREYAPLFRELFDVPGTGAFPVLEALEKLHDVFEGSTYEVLEDDALPPKEMARCVVNEGRGFTVLIKKSVYDGAMDKVGACCGFILHEMVHIFMYMIGYTPILQRNFEVCPPYYSVEWQVKALTGEIAMPYEETKGMSIPEIMERYIVSKGFAESRKKY